MNLSEDSETRTIGIAGWIAIALVLLVLSGCGSSSTPPIPIPPPQTLRTDLLYGYYGDIPAETLPHTNLTFVVNWDTPETQLQYITQAQAAGNCVMIDMAPQLYPLPFNAATAIPKIRSYFEALKSVDLLKSVCALYGIDEPRLHGMDAVATAAMNNAMRTVVAEFGMYDIKIVNVHDITFTKEDVASADVVGFDWYQQDIFGNGAYARLKSYLSPTQLIALVPGEMDDITRFFNVAETDKQVWAILSFAWRDWEGIRGIRNSPALPAFRQAGTKIKTP